MPLVHKDRSWIGAAGVRPWRGAGLTVVACAIVASCSSESDRGAVIGGPGAPGESSGAEPEGAELALLPMLPNTSNGGSGDGSGVAPGTGFIGPEDDVPDDDPSCVDQFVPTSAERPVIQFVVDTSGSMNWVAGTERAPEAGEQSKWQITQQALAAAIDGMPDTVAVGITYYPNTEGDDAACLRAEAAAPIALLSPSQRELIRRVNAAQLPRGGTPTHGAYDFGVEQLAASPVEGSRFLVLMTDGIPTFTRECAGDGRTRVSGAPLILDVAERFGQSDVRTFVIGSPGSEPAREELSQMALVGGTGASGCSNAGPNPCHFDMTGEPDFSLALNQALGEIADATLTCDYAVPPPPSRFRLDLNDVSVVVESGGSRVGEFARSASADCDAGWRYNEDRTSIRLCTSTCDELKALVSADPSIAVRIKFGCRIVPT